MCLIDEKCDAFEYKTELGAIVSTCLLIKLKNSITMEYSFNVRHTGSVDKIVRIVDNLYKTVFERIKLESKSLGGVESCQIAMQSTSLVWDTPVNWRNLMRFTNYITMDNVASIYQSGSLEVLMI